MEHMVPTAPRVWYSTFLNGDIHGFIIFLTKKDTQRSQYEARDDVPSGEYTTWWTSGLIDNYLYNDYKLQYITKEPEQPYWTAVDF